MRLVEAGAVHERELLRLARLVESARHAGGRVLLLHGADGAGQADVVAHVRHLAERAEEPFVVLEGACVPGQTTDCSDARPRFGMGPFHAILSTVARAGQELCSPGALSLATSLLDEHAAEGTGDAAELLQVVRARDGRLSRLESVRRVLCEVAARRPTLVVVHDVDAADDDTLALLDYLLDDAAQTAGTVSGIRSAFGRPTYLLTLSDDAASGRRVLARFRERETVDAVPLEPLDGQGVARMLARPELAQKLLRLTGGVPERVRTLVDVLPDELGSLVAARLVELDDEGLSVLRHATALAEPIGPGALSVLAGASRLTVERLRKRGYLVDHWAPADSPGPRVQPSGHGAGGTPLIRVAQAYSRSPLLRPQDPTELAPLHSACARHLEARYAVSVDRSLLAPMARHFLRAGELEPAGRYALVAADQLSAAAPRSVVDLLEDVLSAGPAEPEPLLVALLDLELGLGRHDAALSHCRRLCASGPDGEAPPALALREARIHVVGEDLGTAAGALRRLLDTPGLPPPIRDTATCELAEVHLRQGELDEAERSCRVRLEAGECKEPFDDPMVPIALRHTLAKVAFWRADYGTAEKRYEDVLARLEQPGLPDKSRRRMRATVLFNVGLVSLRCERYGDAAGRIEEALGLFEQSGDYYEAAVCRHNLGITNEYRQRYGIAKQLFESSIELFERFGRRANLAGAVSSLGDLYLTLGESWRARKLLEHSLDVAEQCGLQFLAAFDRMRIAQLELREGRSREAAVLSEAAVEAFDKLGHRQELQEAHLVRAEVAWADGDISGALLHIEGAEPADANGNERGSRETAARARILRARILAESRPARAHGLALEAADALHVLGQRDGLAQALAVAAAAARRGGQRAEAELLLRRAQDAATELRDRVPADHREAFDALPWQALLRPATGDLGVPRADTSGSEGPAPGDVERRRSRQATAGQPDGCFGMVGASPAMRQVFEMIERLGNCDAPILIAGESGTGKELVAEAIRARSERAGKPFVRVNAAAFADTLLESELFGHEKGAFTGAVARKLGAFEQANGGTLFLDEIGDISPKTQISLLRVLQEREVRRVGGRQAIKVDVRILCATNRNLEEMVAEGTFRLDLYYRVKGLTIEVPPLRERGSDLHLLVEHILAELARKHGRQLSLTPGARALLERYRWPGNVRELENVLRSVYFFAGGDAVTAEELTTYTLLRDAGPGDMEPAPAGCSAGAADAGGADSGDDDGYSDEVLEDGFDLAEAKRALEVRCITNALKKTGGNITHAAHLLGMKRPRLSQKVKEYRIPIR